MYTNEIWTSYLWPCHNHLVKRLDAAARAQIPSCLDNSRPHRAAVTVRFFTQ